MARTRDGNNLLIRSSSGGLGGFCLVLCSHSHWPKSVASLPGRQRASAWSHLEEGHSSSILHCPVLYFCLLCQVICRVNGGFHPLHRQEGSKVGRVGRDDNEGEEPPYATNDACRQSFGHQLRAWGGSGGGRRRGEGTKRMDLGYAYRGPLYTYVHIEGVRFHCQNCNRYTVNANWF